MSADATSYSFVVGSQGTVRVVVIAYDAANRPSPTDSTDIRVGEPEPGGALNLWWLAFILIFAVGVLIAFAVGKGNRYIVGGIILMFLVLAYVGAGVVGAV